MRHALPFAVSLLAVLLVSLPATASAQEILLDFGGGKVSSTVVQMIALITVLSVAPGLAIMITCFPFIVTVFAILRQAIGLQQSPPNMLMVSLALFLTLFVMEPVFRASWAQGIHPLITEDLPIEEAFTRGLAPFREFMAARVDPDTFTMMRDIRPDIRETEVTPDSALPVLVVTFMLSEITRAFQIGFLIFLPFLIIDMVVAAVLMSMGMMMVPPAIVSLPFKLSFFALADGWTLVAQSLVRSYQ